MINSTRRMHSGRGFTLVELLVVISIIALLLAILIPTLSRAKELAQRIVCGHHLKDFGMANALYASVCNGFYLPIEYLDSNAQGRTVVGVPPRNFDDIKWMQNRLFRSFVHYDSFPKDKKNASNSPAYFSPYNMPKALLCPSDTISIDWQNKFGDGTYSGVLVSYAYNVTDWPVNFNGPIAAYYLGFRIIEVKQPSAKISFIDGIDWWATYYGRSADYHIAWDTHGQMSINDYRNNSMGTPCWGPVIYRHNEGANCGFYDGHVKYMKKQVIYNPSSLGMWSVRH